MVSFFILRSLRVAFVSFAWLLKFVFWLPMLVIYLADNRIEKDELAYYILFAVCGFVFFAFAPAIKFFAPEMPWPIALLLPLLINYSIGATTLAGLYGDGNLIRSPP